MCIMKLKKGLLLSVFLLPVLLASCAETVDSSGSSIQDNQSVQVDSNDSSDQVSSDSVDEGGDEGGDDVGQDDGLIAQDESPWSNDITALMIQHLGGNIIPFVELSNGTIDAKYVENDENDNYRSYLLLTGGRYLESRLDDAVEGYKEHKWDALTFSGSFYATRSDLGLEVNVRKNSSGLFELRAYFNEAFDPTALADWTAETKALLVDRFGRFTVPFVYLGTSSYHASFTAEGAFEVLGGTWNDGVLSQFRSAFAAWEITEDPDVLTTLHATKTDADGSVLTATLDQYNTKARLQVSLTETFDAKNQTVWSNDVLSYMKSALNQRVLPYVYLGTTYPTVDSKNSDTRKITVLGKLWDDSIIDAAKTAFAADGWTEVSSGLTEVSFTKTEGGEIIDASIAKNEAGIPVLTAERAEAYDESALTSWPEDLKEAYAAQYGDSDLEALPFVYLGTAYPTVNQEYTNPEEFRFVVTGGSYNEGSLAMFKTKYGEGSGWISTYTPVNTGQDVDDTEQYGEILGVAIKSIGDYTYSVSLFTLGSGDAKTCYFEVDRSENKSSTATKWSQESVDNVHKYLGEDVSIPFFDLGRDTKEIILDESGTLNLQFSTDINTIFYRLLGAIEAFTNDGWTVDLGHCITYFNSAGWINYIHATKAFGEKTVEATITVSPSYYYIYNVSGSVIVQGEYDKAEATGTWGEEIDTAIQKEFGITLPYIYLGTTSPYLVEADPENDVNTRIYGNALNTEIFTDARKVFEATDGWTIDEEGSNPNCIVAYYQKGVDTIYAVVDYSNGRPYIELYTIEGFDPTEATEWSADVSTVLTENITGTTIPFVYLGTTNVTSEVETSNYVTKVTLTGGEWNDQIISLALDAFDTAGWNTKTVYDSWSGTTFTAYKLLDDCSAVRVRVTGDSYDPATMEIFFDQAPENMPTEATSWETLSDPSKGSSGSVTAAFDSMLGGNEIPAFLIDDLSDGYPSVSTSGKAWSQTNNQYVSLYGYSAIFTPSYMYKSMEILEEDGFEITAFTPFDEKDMPSFTAEKTNETGGSKVRVYYSTYNGYFDRNNNGYKVYIMYLPPLTSDSEAAKGWSNSAASIIGNNLDDLVLPFVYLGDENYKVSSSSSGVSITFYNYSEDFMEMIKEAYENFDGYDGAKWNMFYYYTVSGGEAIKTLGGYLELNGHIYVFSLSFANDYDEVSTTIKIQMA